VCTEPTPGQSPADGSIQCALTATYAKQAAKLAAACSAPSRIHSHAAHLRLTAGILLSTNEGSRLDTAVSIVQAVCFVQPYHERAKPNQPKHSKHSIWATQRGTITCSPATVQAWPTSQHMHPCPHPNTSDWVAFTCPDAVSTALPARATTGMLEKRRKGDRCRVATAGGPSEVQEACPMQRCQHNLIRPPSLPIGCRHRNGAKGQAESYMMQHPAPNNVTGSAGLCSTPGTANPLMRSHSARDQQP
jgi:hypothetical protein